MVQVKVTMGKQPIFRQQRTPQSKINMYGGGFTGVCYFCRRRNHSQKYCPLRRCMRCHAFGHSHQVCMSVQK